MKLLLFLFLLSTSLVSAGGEVTNPSTATLRVSLDDSIRNVANESPIVWDEETNTTPIQIWESDDEIGIEIYAQNNKFHRLTITEAIDNKRRPVYLCYNNYMVNYAYNQVNVSYCENYNYGTMLRELRVGQSINFEIPPIMNLSCGTYPNGTNCTYESNAWSVWVGRGAGGGGGIPVCDTMTISWNAVVTQSQTNGGDWNSSNYNMFSWSIGYVGSTTAGCSPNSWSAEDYSTTRPVIFWRNMLRGDTTNDFWYNETNATANGHFASCYGSGLSFGSSGNCLWSAFDYNNTCLKERNLTTRARLDGTISGVAQSFYSSPVKTEIPNRAYLGDDICLPTTDIELPITKDDDFNPIFMFSIFLFALGARMVKKGKNKTPPAK